MRLFHRTDDESAHSILAKGFRDATGKPDWGIKTDRELKGVWLSDIPLDENEGAQGDVLLVVDLELNEQDLVDYEVCEEGKPYREWLVPSAVINSKGTVRRATEEEGRRGYSAAARPFQEGE